MLDPTPAPTLDLYAGSKSMISYDTAVSIIAAKAKAKEASGKCLGTNELTPSLLSHPYP